jgi:hypothetical protein
MLRHADLNRLRKILSMNPIADRSSVEWNPLDDFAHHDVRRFAKHTALPVQEAPSSVLEMKKPPRQRPMFEARLNRGWRLLTDPIG